MIQMHIPYSRLFYENFLPGAVTLLPKGAYGMVVGTDSDSERVQQIHPDLLREVVSEHLIRWQAAGGEVDEPLREAVQSRRLAIRTPTAVYISPFPLLLQCSDANCQLIDAAGRIARSTRIGALKVRVRDQVKTIGCRYCGGPLRQLPFVQLHRCGRIADMEPPPPARARRVRFHDGRTFFRSHWTDFATGENLGRAFQGECPTCSKRHNGGAATPLAAMRLRSGRAESFYSQLVQFISLRPQTTALLSDFRAAIPDTAELGRAILCSILGLREGSDLRGSLKSAIDQAPPPSSCESEDLQSDQQELRDAIELLRKLPDMEKTINVLSK